MSLGIFHWIINTLKVWTNCFYHDDEAFGVSSSIWNFCNTPI